MAEVIWKDISPTVAHKATGVTLHIVTYADGRFRSFYLGMEQREAKARFQAMMANRIPFEIDDEGWGATLETIVFSANGEAWVGAAGDQLKSLIAKLMGP